MSAKLVQLVLACRFVRQQEKTVLTLLAWHYNEKTGQCNPSLSKLSVETGWSKNTVLKAIRKLEKCGFVRVHRSHGGRKRKTSYSFNRDVIRNGA